MVVYEVLHECAVVAGVLQLLLDLVVTEDLEDGLCLRLLEEIINFVATDLKFTSDIDTSGFLAIKLQQGCKYYKNTWCD